MTFQDVYMFIADCIETLLNDLLNLWHVSLPWLVFRLIVVVFILKISLEVSKSINKWLKNTWLFRAVGYRTSNGLLNNLITSKRKLYELRQLDAELVRESITKDLEQRSKQSEYESLIGNFERKKRQAVMNIYEDDLRHKLALRDLNSDLSTIDEKIQHEQERFLLKRAKMLHIQEIKKLGTENGANSKNNSGSDQDVDRYKRLRDFLQAIEQDTDPVMINEVITALDDHWGFNRED